MHIDFGVSIWTILSILGAALGAGIRFEWKMRALFIEHEILMADYCERNGIHLAHLPTRSSSVFGKI